MKIRRNAIRCNLCGDEIESTDRHQYVTCSCGACAVDGGHDYLRRCFKSKDCYTDLSMTENDKVDENLYDAGLTPKTWAVRHLSLSC